MEKKKNQILAVAVYLNEEAQQSFAFANYGCVYFPNRQ